MRTLLLLRHAKSDWSRVLDDHERPLNARGERARHTIAEHLAARSAGADPLVVDLLVCSTAVRARATAEPVATALGLEVLDDPRIYEASVPRLFEVVHTLPDTATTALVVGHNPGIEELTAALCGSSPPYTTAALGELRLEVSRWADARPGCATLASHVTARGLAGD